MHLEVPAGLRYDSVPTRSSLIARLRDAGDELSWRTFFDSYWRLIYNVARKSGLSDADAQDVVQETVISVARKMPAFRYDPAKGSFKQWLLLITRRRIQDQLRRAYRNGERYVPLAGGVAEQLRTIPAEGPSPDQAIEAAWEQEWRDNFFQAALQRVRHRANPKHYQAFDYCVLQGLSSREVAKMLGLSAAQVYLAKHRISRAVQRMAAELEKQLGRPSGC